MTTSILKPSFTVHHLLIVDTSVRTAQALSDLIGQVNDTLHSIKQSAQKHITQSHRLTLMKIQAGSIACVYHNVSIDEARDLPRSGVNVSAPGQLLDGIGACIGTWRALGSHMTKSDKHQVTLFSSGQDRGSTKYSLCTIKTLIRSLVDIGWHFTMISAAPLLPRVAANLGISCYYICRSPRAKRERNFLISQLRRQWWRQQTELAGSHQVAA